MRLLRKLVTLSFVGVFARVWFFKIPFAHVFFFFAATATAEIYTLSLHDALPICDRDGTAAASTTRRRGDRGHADVCDRPGDRKSARLNSSHVSISYAVFCLKKKTINAIATAPS